CWLVSSVGLEHGATNAGVGSSSLSRVTIWNFGRLGVCAGLKILRTLVRLHEVPQIYIVGCSPVATRADCKSAVIRLRGFLESKASKGRARFPPPQPFIMEFVVQW